MFEWNAKYSVGIRSIDAAHQNLFRTGGELYSTMTAGQGRAALSKILNRLVDYTMVHFAHEERLMSLAGYPGLAAHQVEHRALTQKVMAFQAEFDQGRAPLTVDLLEFLQGWLEKHIAHSDQAYAPFLKSKSAA